MFLQKKYKSYKLAPTYLPEEKNKEVNKLVLKNNIMCTLKIILMYIMIAVLNKQNLFFFLSPNGMPKKLTIFLKYIYIYIKEKKENALKFIYILSNLVILRSSNMNIL